MRKWKNGINTYEEILNLRDDYKENEMTDDEIRDRLEDVDILDLFLAYYFTDCDCEYYRREFNRLNNALHSNKK